jgi:hypothetical protein
MGAFTRAILRIPRIAFLEVFGDFPCAERAMLDACTQLFLMEFAFQSLALSLMLICGSFCCRPQIVARQQEGCCERDREIHQDIGGRGALCTLFLVIETLKGLLKSW